MGGFYSKTVTTMESSIRGVDSGEPEICADLLEFAMGELTDLCEAKNGTCIL